jgi:hypothetical protein
MRYVSVNTCFQHYKTPFLRYGAQQYKNLNNRTGDIFIGTAVPTIRRPSIKNLNNRKGCAFLLGWAGSDIKNHELGWPDKSWSFISKVLSFRESQRNSPWKIKTMWLAEINKFLKIEKGIPNESLRQLPKRQLVHLTHFFNRCILLSRFPTS